MAFDQVLQRLADQARDALDPGRFLHTLGVTHTAVCLAMRHGVDAEAAAIAGLLHDQSKSMAPEAIERDLEERGEAIDEEDRPYPATWHGLHAAGRALDEFGGEDKERGAAIAEALRYHSTAEAGMGPLGKLLFIADTIEPGRDFEGLDEVRRAARGGLEEGFGAALSAKCAYLSERGASISPRAQRALKECQ